VLVEEWDDIYTKIKDAVNEYAKDNLVLFDMICAGFK